MGRIVYIDSLKGLAILSVIVSHVSVFLLVGKINLLSTFVGVYMMPLFFVLSGLVITEIPNRKKLISKLARFLSPFFCFGVFYTYLHGDNIIFFLVDKYKSGYWYLYMLSLFYLFLPLFRKNADARHAVIYDLTVVGVIMLSAKILELLVSPRFVDLFCLDWVARYWFFFVAGFLIRRYNWLPKLDKGWILLLSFFIGILSFIQYVKGITAYIHSATLGSVIFFILFFKRNGLYFNKLNFIFSYFGRNTLDIYCLHYYIVLFLIILFPVPWFKTDLNLLWLVVLSCGLSVIIAFLSILMGKCLHKIYWFDNVVYGKIFSKCFSH